LIDQLKEGPHSTTNMVTTRSQSKERTEEIPEDVRKIKEKLEKETGKKYRYQPGKKDMPSVGDLLKYGAPGQKPPTWKESFQTAML